MKKLIGLVLAISAIIMVGCTEQVDKSARYVFKEKTITDYLSLHEEYDEYVQLLKMTPVSTVSETKVFQLLSARGNYTVFAPTNEAIQAYLDTLYAKETITEPSWNGFRDSITLDSIRKVIVYNSVIDSGDDNVRYETATLPTTQNAELPYPNMYDRKLVVHYCDDPDSILINDALINPRNKDIPAINGVIQSMESVVAPSNNTLAFLLTDIINNKKEGYYVAAQLVSATGLMDTLKVWRDEVYEELYKKGTVKMSIVSNTDGSNQTFYSPEHRYVGFTFFAETDSVWAALLGKPALEIEVKDVVDYLIQNNIYPDAARNDNYKDENNILNQFVTYHFLPMSLSTDRLVLHYNENGYNPNNGNPTVPIMEFYTTMGKRRLIKLFESKESNGVYINRFPKLKNGRRENYHEDYCEPDKEGIKVGVPDLNGENNVRNGLIYPIGKLLVYDETTRNCLQSNRIRWNVTAMWPEFMTNGIRSSEITDDRHKCVYIPSDGAYKYLNDVSISEETNFLYWTGRGNGWQNMQGDEMSIRGLTDCTMRLPPVPKRGTYELRYAIQCGGNMRGMVQFYWGKDPERLAAMGIPMDLRQGAYAKNTSTGTVPSDIGYAADTQDDDYNAEIDKRLRNNGFMKGCQQYTAGAPGGSDMMRKSDICIRRILLRETMDPEETYYIRFKTVMDDPTRYFYMDYLEYCAKEVYDNPVEPEDIW
ncbi:MAG: fasciclin domain-containing protein [Bacteroidaceae bacterium]